MLSTNSVMKSQHLDMAYAHTHLSMLSAYNDEQNKMLELTNRNHYNGGCFDQPSANSILYNVY